MQRLIKETTKKKLVISYDVLEKCGLERGEPLEIRAMTNAAVILKPRMHALEVIHAINSLQWLVHELAGCLMESCGRCDGGDKCAESTNGTCPYLPSATNSLRPEVLREAGIPSGVKLRAQVNEGTNTVTVAQADYRYDLTDVPDRLLTSLAIARVCVGSLEKRLMAEDAVYE